MDAIPLPERELKEFKLILGGVVQRITKVIPKCQGGVGWGGA